MKKRLVAAVKICVIKCNLQLKLSHPHIFAAATNLFSHVVMNCGG